MVDICASGMRMGDLRRCDGRRCLRRVVFGGDLSCSGRFGGAGSMHGDGDGGDAVVGGGFDDVYGR